MRKIADVLFVLNSVFASLCSLSLFVNVIAHALFYRHKVLGDTRQIGSRPDTQRIPDIVPKAPIVYYRWRVARKVFFARDKYFGWRINLICFKSISPTYAKDMWNNLPELTKISINYSGAIFKKDANLACTDRKSVKSRRQPWFLTDLCPRIPRGIPVMRSMLFRQHIVISDVSIGKNTYLIFTQGSRCQKKRSIKRFWLSNCNLRARKYGRPCGIYAA